ncbi:uncharacterized protein LOC118510228 [Anopheles stephensi]|uniref:uncharacterized protein LOC118510228 n=1 Tax=Anopheles stephensi TaxID=30069 RepID=UPI001658736B|nr:uncharacterized protein LOC118510228 [Anopheles stephensi]
MIAVEKVKMKPLKMHLLAACIAIVSVLPAQGLEIEHPHSFSTFKRGVMLSDVSYSYSSTDMGSPESGRYKTVTVIKNIAVPKPTSTMFSDRSEHYYDAVEKTSATGTTQKKRTHVEYWPPKAENQVAHRLKLEQDFHKVSNTHRPKGNDRQHQKQRHHSRQEILATPTKPTYNKPAEIQEQPQEEPQHPVDLLELAKSAAKTLAEKAKVAPGENTGPVTFPSNAMTMKKQNGIVSVANEYTSILTTDQNDRQPIVSKLRTKVDPPTKVPTYSSTTSSSEAQEIKLKDLEQSEYVFNHKTGKFEFRTASKAPKAVQEYLRGTPYVFREESMSAKEQETPNSSNTYSTPSELLFAELHNAVVTRNVTMIKSLASQLEETFNIGKLDFESLKTEMDGGRRTTEDPMMVAMAETTTVRSSFDFGYGNYAETTTTMVNYPEATTEAMVASTTIKAPVMMLMTTTKKPLRYIAPKLRGFKRFSSKRQNQ